MLDTYLVVAIDVCITVVSFLITAYIYRKVSIVSINQHYRNAFVLAAACLFISLAYVFLKTISSAVASLVSYLFPSFFFILLEKEKRRLKCMIAFLSSSLNRIITFISTCFISVLVASIAPNINPQQEDVFGQFIILFVQIFALILSVLLFRIKRLRKGFQFFQNENNLGLGMALSGVLFILFCITYTYKIKSQLFGIVLLLGLTIFVFGVFLWIRRSITAHYRERLQLRSEEHYQELLKEKEQENEKLSQSNEYLAKVVHRDNHLMSALNTSVSAYFESDDAEQKDELLRQIQMLAKERSDLLAKEQRDYKILPSTGNLLIDGAINDLYFKAAAHGIEFDLSVSDAVDEIIGKYISQIDLQTLISDHIKDAIIAVEAMGNESGQILVELSVKNNHYTITIYDSGVDFEPETLAKLGTERVTTHPETGGNGIGFMTTFETLRRAHASLVITEFENKMPFSKSISFLFDGKGSFAIQSYRSEILKDCLSRDDIIIW